MDILYSLFSVFTNNLPVLYPGGNREVDDSGSKRRVKGGHKGRETICKYSYQRPFGDLDLLSRISSRLLLLLPLLTDLERLLLRVYLEYDEYDMERDRDRERERERDLERERLERTEWLLDLERRLRS